MNYPHPLSPNLILIKNKLILKVLNHNKEIKFRILMALKNHKAIIMRMKSKNLMICTIKLHNLSQVRKFKLFVIS